MDTETKTTEKTAKAPKKNKAVNIIINTVLVVVLLFGIFCSYTAFVSKSGSGVPDIFGMRIFSIQSNSMADTFYKGDLIVDVRVDDVTTLKENDIITFYTIIQGKRALNTHRIVKIEDKGTYLYFTTQGDAYDETDNLGVHQRDIVGKYCFKIPGVGSVIDFLQTSTGFLIVIVLPVFLFFIYNLVAFFRVFFDYRTKKLKLKLRQELLREQELANLGLNDIDEKDGLEDDE